MAWESTRWSPKALTTTHFRSTTDRKTARMKRKRRKEEEEEKKEEKKEEESWDNTMVLANRDDDDKHWQRVAKCFGLAELFWRFGNQFTAKQLYKYYVSVRVEAAKQRKGKTGRWGHGKD